MDDQIDQRLSFASTNDLIEELSRRYSMIVWAGCLADARPGKESLTFDTWVDPRVAASDLLGLCGRMSAELHDIHLIEHGFEVEIEGEG